MLVSAIVTVRNEEHNIGDLLDSLVMQEQPFEVVVVDAGSEDKTTDIIQSYHERYKFVRLYSEGGTRGEGRNFGVRMAKGDIVAMIDGDCIANAFWAKELREAIDEGADIVAGRTIAIGYAPFVKLSRVPVYYKGIDLTWPSCNLAYKKEVFDSIGGFDPWFRTAEDIDLNFRAINKDYKFVHMERAVVYHRERSTFFDFGRQAFWNGYGRKQLTLKHGSLWGNYKPTAMIEAGGMNVWYYIRLIVALLGYWTAKAREDGPDPENQD